VRAGAVRIAAGPEEHHTAENPASTPSDFLRIWFKTDNAGERNLRRRLSPTDDTFENKQMRITRLIVAPDKVITIETPVDQPALWITVASGQTRWFEGGQRVQLEVGHLPTEFIRIDFLTKPANP
jgi:hypothetical protein